MFLRVRKRRPLQSSRAHIAMIAQCEFARRGAKEQRSKSRLNQESPTVGWHLAQPSSQTKQQDLQSEQQQRRNSENDSRAARRVFSVFRGALKTGSTLRLRQAAYSEFPRNEEVQSSMSAKLTATRYKPVELDKCACIWSKPGCRQLRESASAHKQRTYEMC